MWVGVWVGMLVLCVGVWVAMLVLCVLGSIASGIDYIRDRRRLINVTSAGLPLTRLVIPTPLPNQETLNTPNEYPQSYFRTLALALVHTNTHIRTRILTLTHTCT